MDEHRAGLKVGRVEFAELHVRHNNPTGDMCRVERVVWPVSNINRPGL